MYSARINRNNEFQALYMLVLKQEQARSLFFLLLSSIPLYKYGNFFIHYPADGFFYRFKFLAIMYKAAVNLLLTGL